MNEQLLEEGRAGWPRCVTPEPAGPYLHPLVVKAGLVLQPVCLAHIALLKKINSPLATMFNGKPADTKADREPLRCDAEEVFEIVYLFSRPVAEIRKRLMSPLEFSKRPAPKSASERRWKRARPFAKRRLRPRRMFFRITC